MAIAIHIYVYQTCRSRGLAAPRPQKSAKNVENWRFLTILATASRKTAGRTASGRTSAEPAWAGQQILRNVLSASNSQGARYAQ